MAQASPHRVTAQAWQTPRRIDAIDFWLRSRLLAAAHAVREALRPSARRWPGAAHARLADAPVIAQCRTPLWADGRADEFPLVAGKVQNLRVARHAFDAVEVPAGEVLSFWRQLGRPGAARGFVVGRELRGGCVVPTLAGGLCQLSNALATVAARAGFELVERHAHTARIEDASAGDSDAVDATVFWNYVDLKLRARQAWRLEVELTADELVLRIRARQAAPVRVAPPATRAVPGAASKAAVGGLPATVDAPSTNVGAPLANVGAPLARGCLSCAQADCFRHRPQAPAAATGRTAVLLDALSPEFARHIDAAHAGADRIHAVPVRLAFWRGRAAAAGPDGGRALWAASLRRALWQRLWAGSAGRRQASLIDGQRWIARAASARLDPAHTHVVVDQALLPHLQQLGVLDGREVTVLAAALPMAAIESRLDAAALRWPGDATLRDFRADPALVRAETLALARARRIVTPHAEVAARFAPSRVQRLDWELPAAAAGRPVPAAAAAAAAAGRPVPAPLGTAPLIVFAASALARKGARELAAALQGTGWRLRVLGSASDDAALWRGVAHVEHMHWRGDWLAGAAVVVLPAHVEHAPRALLRAVAAGVPAVASTACGLAGVAGVHTVAPGDIDALRAALTRCVVGAPAH